MFVVESKISLIVIFLISVFEEVNGLGLGNQKVLINQVVKSAPSPIVNAWRVCISGNNELQNKTFLITPAHVAIYSKDSTWLMSNFLRDLKHLEWKIPSSYVESPSPYDDLCWCDVSSISEYISSHDDYLTIETSDKQSLPECTDLYFRQPYNINGIWVNGSSTVGVTEATLYDVPSTDDSELTMSGHHRLKEALDEGFRGMSGAVVLKRDSTHLVGMFVKRGSLIPFKSKASVKTPLTIPSPAPIPAPVTIVRSISEPIGDEADLTESFPQQLEFNFFQKIIRAISGSDIADKRMAERDRRRDRRMEHKVAGMVTSLDTKLDGVERNLLDQMLKKSDLKEVGAVLDARRGVFLSAAAIPDLISSPCRSIRDIVNTQAPFIESQ